MMFNFGLVGNPIKHSMSPDIHLNFAKQFNHQIQYKLYNIKDLKAFLQEFQTYGHGLNITTPFKQQILTLVPNTKKLNNANVLTINPTIEAFCVDGTGFINACNKLGWSIKDKDILIIGAGNTAHSIITETKAQNNITIAARSVDKATTKLQAHLTSITIKDIKNIQQQFDIIIQASSAGLHNTIPFINPYWVKTTAYVMDLNYGNNASKFIDKITKLNPKQILDGRFMLIEQAALSYFLWTGDYPNTNEFYQL